MKSHNWRDINSSSFCGNCKNNGTDAEEKNNENSFVGYDG
jgi:hypothetical protein